MIHGWRYSRSPSEPGPLIEWTVPEHELDADQVSVAVAACVFAAPERASLTEFIPGGAAVGTVVAAGQSAGHLVGQRVVVGAEQGCGECEVCRRGAVAVCPSGTILGRTAHGTLARRVVARARWLCVLGGDLDIPGPAACLLGREAAWAYTLYARAGVAPGEPVVIVGGGVVARLLAEIAAARGIRPMVLVSAAQPRFAEWIATRGGSAVIAELPAPDDADGLAQLGRAVAESAHAGGFGIRPRCVFETTATARGRAAAWAVAGPAARIALLDTGVPEPASSERAPAVATLATSDSLCIGVAGSHPDLLPELAALVVRGQLDLAGAATITPLAEFADGAIEPGDPPTAQVLTIADSESL